MMRKGDDMTTMTENAGQALRVAGKIVDKATAGTQARNSATGMPPASETPQSEEARVQYVAPEVVERLMKFLDALAFATVTGTGMYYLVPLAELQGTGRTSALIVTILLATLHVFATVWTLRESGHYKLRALLNPGLRVATGLGVVMLAGAATGLVGRWLLGLPVLDWLRLWGVSAGGWFVVSRLLAWAWARPLEKKGAFKRHIVIVGGGKAAERAIDTLEGSPDLDVKILGLFDDREDNRSPEHVRKYRKLGRIADLAAYARDNRVDLLVVAIPLSAEKRLLQILDKIWELPVDIRISGQESKLKLSPRAYDYLGNLPLLAVFDRPLSPWDWFLKAVFDRVMAALILVLVSPIMALVAIAIKLETEGPVIFRQKRYGFNNKMVEIWKFRSMYIDMCDAEASKLTTKDDPRVTKVGRFIRKTSIDELPQLFNVLKGDISLVGPRPHCKQAKAAGEIYEKVVEGYFARQKVKPGITGWAQINGWRGDTDTEEKIHMRVKYDLEYINNWSLWFDFYILVKTPFALLSPENRANAY